MLNINADDVGAVDNILGVAVLTNSKITAGTAIVFDMTKAVQAWTRLGIELMVDQFGDTEWSTNAVSFRCEERMAIGGGSPHGDMHGDGPELMKVEVIGNFQVAHAGQVWRRGAVAQVPDHVATRWIAAGCVTEVRSRSRRKES